MSYLIARGLQRGGELLIMALTATCIPVSATTAISWQQSERTMISVIAADWGPRDHAGTFARSSPQYRSLAKTIQREIARSSDLRNRAAMRSQGQRSTRGYTYAAMMSDEFAFWLDYNAAETDLTSMRPTGAWPTKL